MANTLSNGKTLFKYIKRSCSERDHTIHGENEDHFSSLVQMKTKSSIEDLYGSTRGQRLLEYVIPITAPAPTPQPKRRALDGRLGYTVTSNHKSAE